MSNIKLKKILEENFSGTVVGGVVSQNPWHDNISLSKTSLRLYRALLGLHRALDLHGWDHEGLGPFI